MAWAVFFGLLVLGLCIDNGLTNIAKNIGEKR